MLHSSTGSRHFILFMHTWIIKYMAVNLHNWKLDYHELIELVPFTCISITVCETQKGAHAQAKPVTLGITLITFAKKGGCVFRPVCLFVR